MLPYTRAVKALSRAVAAVASERAAVGRSSSLWTLRPIITDNDRPHSTQLKFTTWIRPPESSSRFVSFGYQIQQGKVTSPNLSSQKKQTKGIGKRQRSLLRFTGEVQSVHSDRERKVFHIRSMSPCICHQCCCKGLGAPPPPREIALGEAGGNAKAEKVGCCWWESC
jgi:hypothetical protein